MPTVFDLAGIPVPDGLDGQSLAAAMLGTDPDPAERPVFSELISSANECFLHTGNRSCRLGRFAVQTRRFKLVTSEIPRRKRFYDLAADPAETRDVSHRFPKERAQHQALLTEYLESSESQPHTTDHDSPGLDAELRERLKALGYVE
jgi:arylsulfatase A-like enzyme